MMARRKARPPGPPSSVHPHPFAPAPASARGSLRRHPSSLLRCLSDDDSSRGRQGHVRASFSACVIYPSHSPLRSINRTKTPSTGPGACEQRMAGSSAAAAATARVRCCTGCRAGVGYSHLDLSPAHRATNSRGPAPTQHPYTDGGPQPGRGQPAREARAVFGAAAEPRPALRQHHVREGESWGLAVLPAVV